MNDILVTGKMEEQHLVAPEKALDPLEQAGLRLKGSNCFFMAPSVAYLGHRVDAEGLHPNSEKVEAVVQDPDPRIIPS